MTSLRLYTPIEVAEILGIHPQTVRRMCRARQIGHTELGSGHIKARYVISEGDLQAFLRTRTVPALQRRP